ncbi:oral cancer-overexpressed protein 1 [Biomphalaria glabrata]|nr:putative oral cancer-overexpressed protein 1 [Biomphalaria glabrata]
MKTNCDDTDIFHSVTMTEDVSWQEGYKVGLSEGNKKGFLEGYGLGAIKGIELGAEVGFYTGYAASVLNKHSSSESRIAKVCEAILDLGKDFLNLDPTSEELSLNLSKIKGKFKQLTSLLGIHIEYNSTETNTDKIITF